MKAIIRSFFRGVRALLTPLMLLWERLPVRNKVVRDPADQRSIDEKTAHLVLYDFRTCPFCIKVRRAARRLSLNLETRDAQHDEKNREELLSGGGEIKVPCLRITDAQGNVTWLYESDAIISYLEELAGEPTPSRAAAA